MSHRVAGAPLDFAALRRELEVPGDFTSAVIDDARRQADAVELPDEDATDVPLVTIDPAGSRDLDQALHIAPDGDGYLVTYAIADVGAFVRPGSAVDEEAHRRGETLYFPDARVPLHPPVLSEAAASLLPDEVRPAVVWRVALDSSGDVHSVDVRRARVRSRRQLDYAGVQADADRGVLPDAVRLLPDVGRLREQRSRARHAIDLDLPEQVVTQDGDRWTLTLRQPLPVEDHNAQISLLVGTCAAELMLKAKVGIVRTVPEPDPRAVASLRRAAAALGIAWPDGAPPGDVLAGLRRDDPRDFALLDHAAALLRGAGYVHFAGAVPEHPGHAGIGAPYAHVTAPLRRLVDRFGTEICLAIAAQREVPAWVVQALPALPDEMHRSDALAHTVDRAVVDATEAWLLQARVGETFEAVVIDADEHAGTVVVFDPAVRARCDGSALPVGERIPVRLAVADPATHQVRFQAVARQL